MLGNRPIFGYYSVQTSHFWRVIMVALNATEPQLCYHIMAVKHGMVARPIAVNLLTEAMMAARKRKTAESSPQSSLALYVNFADDPDSKEIRKVVDKWREEQHLGELEIIELKGQSIGEPLPCLVTSIGVVGGKRQIEYFVSSDRKARATALAS